jgi:hypothetical protein
MKADAKVIGEGGGNYQVVLLWNEGGKTNRMWWSARTDGDKVTMDGDSPDMKMTGSIADKKLTAEAKGKIEGKFNLTYSVRKSSSEGEAPPEGAVVLLPLAEGKAPSLAEWTNATWKAMPDGSMVVGKGDNFTKKSFGDCRLHLEFWIPYEPDKRDQDRGNSGVYLEGRYEVQVLDSFGLEAKDNDCGGIYGVAVPRSNQCMPPGQWQTYDIVFRAPKVDGDKMIKPAVITVKFNDVKIHDIVKVTKTTTAGVAGPPVESAPLMLQDHGHAVRYRNIWIKELKEGEPGGL